MGSRAYNENTFEIDIYDIVKVLVRHVQEVRCPYNACTPKFASSSYLRHDQSSLADAGRP